MDYWDFYSWHPANERNEPEQEDEYIPSPRKLKAYCEDRGHKVDGGWAASELSFPRVYAFGIDPHEKYSFFGDKPDWTDCPELDFE